MNPAKEFFSLVALYRLYHSLKPHVVHHFTIKPLLYGSLVSRILKTRNVVNSVTGLGYIFIQQGPISAFFRQLAVRMYCVALNLPRHRVIFQNPDDREFFMQKQIVSKDNAVLIRGSGVNCSQFFPQVSPPLPPVVMLASRMLWDKGIGEFVEVANILKKSGCTARFVLVGDVDRGNPSSIPIKQLKMWSNSGLVEWWGFQKDMPDILSRAHIVCLPSYREGTPRVLLEAAALALPLVTTDVPGCREVVKHGENGFLVPPKNSKALAKAIKILILDSDLRKKMGLFGRGFMKKEFSEEVVLERTMNVYRELCV